MPVGPQSCTRVLVLIATCLDCPQELFNLDLAITFLFIYYTARVSLEMSLVGFLRSG